MKSQSATYGVDSMDKSTEIEFQKHESCLYQFHNFLSKMFYKLGHLVALNPYFFIAIPFFISLLGITGIQQIQYEKDPEYLFTPRNGEGYQARKIVQDLFPINQSANFDPFRLTELLPFGHLLVSAKDKGTMLRVKVFEEIVALDENIRNLTVEWEGKQYRYIDLCAQRNGNCTENIILNLNEFMYEVENGSMMINYPIMLYPLVLPFYFGGTFVDEEEGILLEAKVISLGYFLKSATSDQKERSLIFERKLLEFLAMTDFEHIKVDRLTSMSLTDELDNTGRSLTPYFMTNIIIMTAFIIGSVFMADWVRSKLSIGLLGMVSAALATGCAFGLMMYCGVPYIGINMAAPFLMLGIGIDDMFVVLSAWHRTKIQEEVPIRLAKAYSEAAISITITSLTNMMSFFIGTFTPFPAIRIFCLYTGVAILFTYIWFITFFGGCLALAGYQEKKGNHNVTCRAVIAKSKAGDLGCCYKFWCAGGINQEDPWNPEDNKTHVIMVFFRDHFARALNKPIVKALVICLFLFYMGGAIYGCSKVREGLQMKKLTLDGNYLIDYFETDETLFRDFPYRIQVLINQNLTYSDPDTRRALLELHEAFENLTCTAPAMFSQSWIRSYYKFLDRRPHFKEKIVDEKSFIHILKTEFFSHSRINPVDLDVKFNDDDTQIVASRFIIEAFNVTDANEDKQMMLDLRKVAKDSPFNVVVYNMMFVVFDQYLLIKFTCIQTVALASLAMMVVALIFIPNPQCSLWVAFSIISIEIGVIGYMSLWGVNLDSVSVINLIMCVGFSVDFSAHISYAYLTARASTPAGKVEACLFSMGLPVLQGGLSTIVGVLALSITPSYVFKTFFKIVFLVIIFGLMHGLLLLPVMLSLLGPGSCRKKENDLVTNLKFSQHTTIAGVIVQDDLDLANWKSNKDRHLDEENNAQDLGLGSSGSSSSSSLHNVEIRMEGKHPEYLSKRKVPAECIEGGIQNKTFISEDEAYVDEKL